MTAPPIAILGAGMMTGVGLTAPASCAAIRCAIDNFTETRFMARGGEWIIGSAVPLEQPWRGQAKLVKLLAGPVRECLDLIPESKGRGHSAARLRRRTRPAGAAGWARQRAVLRAAAGAGPRLPRGLGDLRRRAGRRRDRSAPRAAAALQGATSRTGT